MAGFNKVILVGNMTRDVEIRTLPSGSMVGGFGIAVNRRIRLSTGEERDEVCFVDCTAFDKKADILRQYTRKGSLILVEGRLRLDAWTDKTTGQPRSKLNVVVENIQLLDKRDPNAQQGGYQQAPGGWGQSQGGYQQAPGGWGQAPQAQGGWGQAQGGYQQPQAGWGQAPQAQGGWGQAQGGYQQPQAGWGQPQNSWNQPAAGNPPPAFQTPPPAPSSFSGATMPPPPAFVPPADVKVDEAPAADAPSEPLPPPPAIDATTAESPNDDLPF